MTKLRDQGAGSVLLLVAIAVVASVSAGVLVVMGGIDARHRAQTSADLAAVAGAARWFEGSAGACLEAKQVADANGGALRTCEVLDGVASVEVVVRSRISWLVEGFVGRARAGPSS